MSQGKAVFLFKLKNAISFDVLSVQEDIRSGQRVEHFFLEVKDANGKCRSYAGYDHRAQTPVEIPYV